MSEDNSNTEITKIGPLTPVFENPELVQQNIKKFREACTKILDPKIDIAMVNGKPFIRKSGWNVLNQYFGVQTLPVKSWRSELPDGEYMITVVVQASLKGIIGPARSASCTSMEMKEKHHGKAYLGMDSHCYGMAETRAVGRVSAAWYMIGDPSAEEVGSQPANFDNKFQGNKDQPTEKQLELLKNLKYTGPKPGTKQIASNIIEDLLNDAKKKKTADTEKPAQSTAPDPSPADLEKSMDNCKCEEPKPKFEISNYTKKHHCYTCGLPVTDEQAKKLLNLS